MREDAADFATAGSPAVAAMGYRNMKPLMDTQQAATLLGLSPATLNSLRSRGGGPVFVKCLARVLYREEDLLDWINARRLDSTASQLTVRDTLTTAPSHTASAE